MIKKDTPICLPYITGPIMNGTHKKNYHKFLKLQIYREKKKVILSTMKNNVIQEKEV